MTQPLMITGRVTDPSGRPVTGAVVAITAAPQPVLDIAALTGKDGRFSISVPQLGDYRVSLRTDRVATEVEVRVGPNGAQIAVGLGA